MQGWGVGKDSGKRRPMSERQRRLLNNRITLRSLSLLLSFLLSWLRVGEISQPGHSSWGMLITVGVNR